MVPRLALVVSEVLRPRIVMSEVPWRGIVIYEISRTRIVMSEVPRP